MHELRVAEQACSDDPAPAACRRLLRDETLHGRPRLDQRAIHREVFGREQRLTWGSARTAARNGGDVAIQQAVTVLAEHSRVVPDRIVDARPTNQRNRQL